MTDDLFSHYLMPLAIAYIMFGVGMNLTFRDFMFTFKKPKAVITGLIAQMILLPAIAFLINFFLPSSPTFMVGLILIAACPGGTTSNLLTFLLKGRLALSVSLTIFNSFLIIFTIPIIVNLALLLYLGKETEIDLPFGRTILEIFVTVLIPTLAGLLVNHYFPQFSERISRFVRISMTVFLLFVFAGIFIAEKGGNGNVFGYIPVYLPAILLNLVSMIAGYILSMAVRIKKRGRYTIAIQVGLQNSALAVYVASKMLDQMEMAVVAVVYGSFSFFSTWLWAYLLKKYI